MRRLSEWKVSRFVLWFAAAWIISVSAFAGTVTVVGTVNDDYQIVSENGTKYEVADTPQGEEVLSFIGEKVKVSGELNDEDGVKMLYVTAFTVMEE